MANELRPCPCGIGDRFEYEGCGQAVQVEHIKAYVCKPPASADKAVIVIRDIFGWQLPNTRYMADRLSANGYIEADAVLKYLKKQCGAKKLEVVGFCWGVIAVRHLVMALPGIKGWCISLWSLLEQKLKKNCKVDYEVKICRGQTHGFVHSRREDINPQDKPYIEEGRKDMISWLNKYIY